MQRAIIAGLFLGALLAVLGVFVALRKMAFFGEGIAHASLAGIALGVLSGLSPMPIALLWGVVLALFIFLLERRTRLSTDAVIGIFFTFSMALGVILMHFTPGYQPELVSFLFGSILAISPSDLLLIGSCSVLILAWLLFFRRQLILISLSEEQAVVTGVRTNLQTALFYIALSVATILGVKMLGIILISALLILPASISQLLTRSLKTHFLASVIVSECMIFFGLVASFYFDLPSGATIVLLGTLLFFVTNLARLLRRS